MTRSQPPGGGSFEDSTEDSSKDLAADRTGAAALPKRENRSVAFKVKFRPHACKGLHANNANMRRGGNGDRIKLGRERRCYLEALESALTKVVCALFNRPFE